MFWPRPVVVLFVVGALGLASLVPAKADGKNTQNRNTEIEQQENSEQVIDLPALKTPSGETVLRSATVTLWIEQGWLSVRRNDELGDVEWQVVLAQTVPDTLPVVEVGKVVPGIEISYGKYFVREHFGRLRILRQKKTVDSPPWPRLTMKDAGAKSSLGMSIWTEKTVQIKGSRQNHWTWAMSGLPDDQFDVWLRLERQELRKQGNGFDGGPKPTRMYYGDKYAIDEGDLFYAERSLPEFADKAVALQTLRQDFAQRPAPPIVASEWLNSPKATSLDRFRGNVILLDFWGTWCGPCVANLPKIQALHEKYKSRGLVVIGVHSLQGGEDVSAFLKKHPLSFPIAIDTGATAESYGIDEVPAYFLIDKSGKSPWGFSRHPPSAEEIEKLLR